MSYQPETSAFFPKLGRGHTQGKSNAKRNAQGDRIPSNPQGCMACRTGSASTHSGQKANREEWEAAVGIKRIARSTRNASRSSAHAAVERTDPKNLRST